MVNMENKMFCYQCEQTAGCAGCMGEIGVCGKTADVAQLQDELTGALIGLAHAVENAGYLPKQAAKVIIEGLFTTLTNVSFDEQAITHQIELTHAKAHMDFINKSIDEIEGELFLRSRQYDTQIKRIATVTGITELSALFILSEIGADMSVFESDRHLCSWAGLTPANNESANKKKSTRCSKAGQYLKPLLIQCALAAVKSKKEPYFAIKYQHLAKRRGKKKAIIAIARMMLTSIYHMLSDNEDFHPDDYEATVHPQKQKPVVLTLDNTLQFLREQGADPETLKLIQRQCAAQAG